MPYPERLIPDSNMRIIPRDKLTATQGLMLIRHNDSDKSMFLGDTKTLNPECIHIQSDHLRDLSNNLLGIFLTEDVYYGIKKEHSDTYLKDWDGKEKCKVPKEEHYFVDTKRGYYFIPVDELTAKPFPDSLFQENTEKYRFTVLHTPTRCNYWHISIRVIDSDGREISQLDMSKKQKSRIWRTVRNYLVLQIVKVKEPPYTTPPIQLYTNSDN